MQSTPKRLVVGALVFLAGCQPPSADTSVATTLSSDAMLVTAVSADEDEDLSWYTNFKIADAAKGEYLLFASSDRPTSTAAVTGFDPATCKGDCTVDGLGAYAGLATSDGVPGPTSTISLQTNTGWGDAKTMYFVIVRRNDAATAAAAPSGRVSGYVGFAANRGGCSNPDGPQLGYEALPAR